MAIFEYIPANGAVTETIDFASGDSADFYQVDLIGGVDYFVTALGAANAGGTLQDPYIEIYDSENNLITFENNDLVFGSDPFLEFQAPADGTYFVGVSDNVGSGSYTFDLDQAGVPSSLIGTPPEEWATVVPDRG